MNKPIRILHVLAGMNMAGTETLLMNIYRNIDRSVVQFDFAVFATSRCPYDEEIESLGGSVIHYPRYRGLNHIEYVRWWDNFLDEHPEYHIIHGHIGSTAAIYLRIAKRKGRYAIAHSHSTSSTINLKSILYGVYSYPTRFVADCFFGCSKQALIDRYGKKVANNKDISMVFNNAIDSQSFAFNSQIREQIRNEYNLNQNELVLGTVGRLTEQKNPFGIINICKELKNREVVFKFLWFGTGPLENKILAEIKRVGCDDVIKLCGTRSDINNILQALDIFVFPSIWEGLGIACVEAQAAGLPTLCSDTIPQEAKVSDLCKFIPLNDTSVWCDEIEYQSSIVIMPQYSRKNMVSVIKQSGFDIQELTKWLGSFYMKKW